MTLGQPTDRPSDTSPPVAHFQNTVLSWHKGIQSFLNLSNQLKEKYKLPDSVIETAIGRPLGFLSRVRNGRISHPDYYYNFNAYCKKLSELLAEYEKRETSTQPPDPTADLRQSFHDQCQAASDTETIIETPTSSTFLWQFPEEWFSLSYHEAIVLCIEAFDSSYVQTVAKMTQYNISQSAILSQTDRKNFRKLFNKHDGKPIYYDFTPEDLSSSFGDLKKSWINDFKMQYVIHALKKGDGGVTRIARDIGVDRKCLYELRKRFSVINDPQ